MRDLHLSDSSETAHSISKWNLIYYLWNNFFSSERHTVIKGVSQMWVFVGKFSFFMRIFRYTARIVCKYHRFVKAFGHSLLKLREWFRSPVSAFVWYYYRFLWINPQARLWLTKKVFAIAFYLILIKKKFKFFILWTI